MAEGGGDDFIRVRLLLIGDAQESKTSLIHRYTNVQREPSFISMGVDCVSKDVLVADRLVKVQIWDTAGQERFHTITTSFYRHNHGALAVYDVNNRKTFDKVRAHIENCQRVRANSRLCAIILIYSPLFLVSSQNSPDFKIVLVGDKAESLSSEGEEGSHSSHSAESDRREVSYEEGAALARELGVPFVETSAKYDVNVDLAFSTLIDLVDPLHNPSLCLACASKGPEEKPITLSAKDRQSNPRSSSCW